MKRARFRFKHEKKEEFLEGQTATYIAKKIGITREYLQYILNNTYNCTKQVALLISIYRNKEISYYFDELVD